MPRIIFKCNYLKDSAKKHISNIVKYIATRDGVDKMSDTDKNLPCTNEQKRLIEQIICDNPDSTKLFEYIDYLEKQTQGNASEFISRAIDENYDLAGKKKNYVDYIANRPRVEKLGSHGLFTATDEPINISHVADEVSNHKGNVWTNIISIRREDATRLGYDNAKRWMALLRSHANEIADNMKIAPENFRWYAAMHNESHHPHVHIIVFSKDPKEGYMTEQGIENIRSSLAKDIFRQDLMQIYSEQTRVRNELAVDSKNTMQDIICQIESGSYKNEKVEQLLLELYRKLKNTTGKKAYGYLKEDVKAIIDSIVDELAKDERLIRLYELWYEQRYAVLRTYTDTLPPKQPLSQQKEFKSIKNMVIAKALKLSDHHFDYKEDDMQNTAENISDDTTIISDDNFSNEKTLIEITGTDKLNISTLSAVTRLFKYCSSLIANEVDRKGKQEQHIDKKLLREIDDKKQAHGIRM